jgi:hypothetical protein
MAQTLIMQTRKGFRNLGVTRGVTANQQQKIVTCCPGQCQPMSGLSLN